MSAVNAQLAGTSTGAILAADLASKGANSKSSILESANTHYQNQIHCFKGNRNTQDATLKAEGLLPLDRGQAVDAGVLTHRLSP
jgi:hypothetical protein